MQHFPVQWSTSVIVPIHKGGELDDPNNFRGITLNSCLSKLFTLLLNERLTQFCNDEGLIKENQIGFRKGFRTSDHIFTLKTLIDQFFSRKNKLFVCFVDFKKAYDTVWRNGLYLKLLKNRVSAKFINLIKDMYSKLQASINISNGLSVPFKSLVGLKQGCNLSPTMFNIFINDFVDMLNRDNYEAPFLQNMQVSCLLYADDLILISDSEKGLQNSLDKLDIFTRTWFLEVNLRKTKCLTFAKGRPSKTPRWSLGAIPLEVCSSYCYLGVVFSCSGSMKSAAQALYDKSIGAMFSIIRNINKHNTCNIPILLDIFDKMVLPIALYNNSEVWGTNILPLNIKNEICPFNENNISKHLTESLQLKFLKLVLRVPSRTSNWAVISEVGKYSVTLKIIKSMIKFLIHITRSPSKIINAALVTSASLSQGNSWYKCVYALLKFCNIEHILYTADAAEIGHKLSNLDTNLRTLYKEQWNRERINFQTQSKLDFFTQLKDKFGMSDYLKLIKNPLHRIAITKMRVSAHKFPIETGRYMNIDRVDRECPFGCNALGNEQHYILHCSHPFLTNIRNPIIESLTLLNPNMVNLENESKCKFLLNNSDPISLGLIGKLCYKIQDKYKEMTF